MRFTFALMRLYGAGHTHRGSGDETTRVGEMVKISSSKNNLLIFIVSFCNNRRNLASYGEDVASYHKVRLLIEVRHFPGSQISDLLVKNEF